MTSESNKSAVDTLQALLRIPSYSGQEKPKQLFIQENLKKSGVESFFQGDNLIVHLVGQDQTRAFIFNGHVDVVDVGNESRWTHRPWSAEIENGRIYSRGASDMQMGVSAEMEVAKKLSARETLPCDVWFTFVVREEVDGSGTQEFASWFKEEGYTQKYREMAAIFGEPTNLDTAEYGHRGNYFIRAEIDGDAGHASRPAKIRVHAVDLMSRFIRDVRIESAKWQKQFQNGEFVPPTITVTAMEAKTGSPNKVSDHAEATFDLRTIPSFHKDAFERIRELAGKRGIRLSLLYPDAPTGYTNRDARIIRELQALVPNLHLKVNEASADLGFFTGLGIEGILFGPGETSQSHIINESAPINHLERSIDIYEKLYDRWALRE